MKRGVLLAVGLLLALLLIPAVHSIGLVYPKSYFKLMIPFVENGEYSLTYKVRTNSGSTIDYTLWAEGKFAQYVTFDPPILKDVPTGSLIPFTATIHFPDSFSEAGPYNLDIYVGESENRGGGSMGVRTTSHHSVTIMVPYPYLYADMGFSATNVNENQPVPFKAVVRNLGKKDIESGVLTVNVYDSNFDLVGNISSGRVYIPSQETYDYSLSWDTEGIAPGEYTAFAKLVYDGEETTGQARFKVGTLKVLISNYTSVFRPDVINRFDIGVSSLWNSPLSDVYAEVILPDQPVMQTPTIRMDEFGDEVLSTFWDTTGVSLGQVEGEIKLYYNGKMDSQPILLEVKELKTPVVETPSLGLAGLMNFSTVLIIVVVVLILVEVVWMFKRKRK